MNRRSRVSDRRSPCLLALLGASAAFVFLSLNLSGCGLTQTTTDSPGSGSLPTATATASEATTGTLPVIVPSELSPLRGLEERLLAQGVPVEELREIPTEDYGTGIEVILNSTSPGEKATPDDAINTHLVFRAAVLENMAGSQIDAVAVAFLKEDEITAPLVVPLDRTIDGTWNETPGLPLEDTNMLAHEYVLGNLPRLLYEADEFRVTEDSDGTRVLRAKLVLTNTGLTKELIEEPFVLFGEAVQSLNRRAPTKIGLVLVEMSDTAGEPILCSIGDLQLGSETWWEAGRVTNGVYPRSGPESPAAGLILPDEMPPDFGFVAAYGPGGSNVLDTFAGNFTKDIISPSKPNPTTELRLTSEELATLYNDLVALDILAYPSVFRPELGEQEVAWGEPHDNYLLSIRTSGIEKDVAWDAGYFGPEPRAEALRGWFSKLRRMIEAKPEYQALPPVEGGYL